MKTELSNSLSDNEPADPLKPKLVHYNLYVMHAGFVWVAKGHGLTLIQGVMQV
jgi:hypothetical protein